MERDEGYEEIFRALVLGNVDLRSRSWGDLTACVGALDGRSEALARLGALIALGAPATPVTLAVDDAISAGVRAEELMAVVLALAPVVGTARLMEAAPAIGMAFGIDVDGLLERE